MGFATPGVVVLRLPERKPPAEQVQIRPRRSHKKSRAGCTNCKASRVKCDETPGGCTRCTRRNTACSLGSQTSSIVAHRRVQMPVKQFTRPFLLPKADPAGHVFSASLIERSLFSSSSTGAVEDAAITFGVTELALLDHFREYTCKSVGGAVTQALYRTEVVAYALQNPYLMQAILTFSMAHLRTLQSSHAVPSDKETISWQRTLLAFISRLSGPLPEEHVNSMLATATMICGLAFAVKPSQNPLECWPWTTNGADLQWLKVQCGIGIVLRNAPVGGSPNAFRELFMTVEESQNTTSNISTKPFDDFDRIIFELELLCEIDAQPTPASNPYALPLQLLSPLLREKCSSSDDVLIYVGFIGSASSDFITLLEALDHRALLLLCLWFASVASAPCWWISSRSQLDCKALSTWLNTYGDENIRMALADCAGVCGYGTILEAIQGL